ncbi:MAG TPA: NAD(P)/FAD-dependent oxidoreductase [Chloroflexota bacterium]|nr:NAD(P)/FAD-dependent oxidoreductase [Chloroflexota bacterium]
MYDVAIAGASFAGLALATRLRGRVVVVDHQPAGAGQTSACGTTVSALQDVGALDTIQQVHRDLVLHLAPERGDPQTLRYRLPEPFCTFDYGALCRLLADRARGRGVEIRVARVTGSRDGRLLTDSGEIEARCVVDATGWRAAIASALRPGYVRRQDLSCGLEAELPQPALQRAEGLHFWAGHGTVWPGYAWAFPAGPVSRLGVIAYPESGQNPSKDLREALDTFLDGPGSEYWSPDGEHPWERGAGRPTAGRHLHGGFLPAAPRPPVVGDVCVVGDAAGHCFGLTGEGIRAALGLALACGDALQDAIDGHTTFRAARGRYARRVTQRISYWRLMRALQRVVSRMGDCGLARYSRAAHPAPMFQFLMWQYLWPTRPHRPE